MKINVLCVGKLKEDYYKKAQEEYVKMLKRFCTVSVIEVQDEPLMRVKSEKDEQSVLQTEGERVLSKCEGLIVVCALEGKKYTSEGFANTLKEKMLNGNSTITFVIGGSLGLSDIVKKRADVMLCVSDMTLPHRLFRVVLLEQIYRAFKILNNEQYHK